MTIHYLATPIRHGDVHRTTLDGVDYTLEWRWNARSSRWWVQLSDDTGVIAYVPIVAGFPMIRSVTGTRRPPGELFVVDLTENGREPSFAWGDDFVFVYDDDPPWKRTP